MKRLIAGLGAAVVLLLALAGPVSANVIPDNPRHGDRVTTRMWCFKGTVTFTIVGPGVSRVVGSVQATAYPEGKAELTFTLPSDIPVGSYTMVGRGQACDEDRDREVRVGFVVRGQGGGPSYPPGSNGITTDRGSVNPGGRIVATARYFTGPVQFTLIDTGQSLGTATAGADGLSSVSFDAPTKPGVYSVGASGTGADGKAASVSTSFNVVGATPTPQPAAPSTPSTSAPSNPVQTAPTVVVLPAAPQPASPAVVVPQVQVAGATEVRGAVLARTGSNSFGLLRIAIGVVTIGGALLVIGRRRLTAH